MFMQSQPTQIEFLEVTRGCRVDKEYDKWKRCLYYANYCWHDKVELVVSVKILYLTVDIPRVICLIYSDRKSRINVMYYYQICLHKTGIQAVHINQIIIMLVFFPIFPGKWKNMAYMYNNFVAFIFQCTSIV